MVVYEKNIIVQYYLRENCIGYLFRSMLQNVFSRVNHRCKTQSEIFDTLAKCQRCFMFFQGVFGENYVL